MPVAGGEPLAMVWLGLPAGVVADTVGVAAAVDSVGVTVDVVVAVVVTVVLAVAVVVAVSVLVAVAVIVAVAVPDGTPVGDAEAVGVDVVVSGCVGTDAVGSATDGDWDAALEIASDADERISDALLDRALPNAPLPASPLHAVKLRSPITAVTAIAQERALVIGVSPEVASPRPVDQTGQRRSSLLPTPGRLELDHGGPHPWIPFLQRRVLRAPARWRATFESITGAVSARPCGSSVPSPIGSNSNDATGRVTVRSSCERAID